MPAETEIQKPAIGEQRESETLGLLLECVGFTHLGWIRYVHVDNPRARRESCPAELWETYRLVKRGG